MLSVRCRAVGHVTTMQSNCAMAIRTSDFVSFRLKCFGDGNSFPVAYFLAIADE